MTHVEVDMEALLHEIASGGSAPTYRAVTVTEITGGHGLSLSVPRRRGIDEKILPGAFVLIDTNPPPVARPTARRPYHRGGWGGHGGFWRLSPATTREPTPFRVASRVVMQPMGAGAIDRIAEAHGLVIFQTPESLVEAATYQHSKGRIELTLTMIHTAILVRAKHDPSVAAREAEYQRFRKTTALALRPATDGEGAAAYGRAWITGLRLVTT